MALATLGVVAALVAGGVALLMSGPSAPPALDPSAPPAAQLERCIGCHETAADNPGGAHDARVIGCEPCHLGDPKAVSAEAAHRGMEPEPGALRTVDRTCGRCHAREAERVRGSLMATARGIVAVDRWAFGERPTPDGDETMADVLAAPHPTPAEDHLRRLCAGCHLGTTRDNRDDAIVQGASGCSACHAPARPPRPDGAALLAHPTVDSRVDDGRCLGCHSRSGRIALGYQGLFETSGSGIEACPEGDRVVLHDGRTGCRAPADVHQRAGMACIDCHVHTELMGDGTAWRHEEEATEVRCESCHGARSEAPRERTPTTWGAVSDMITLDILRQRGEVRAPEEAVRSGLRGTPLWNVRPAATGPAGGWALVGKLDGRSHVIRATPRDPDHTRPGHERLTCASCHDAWAPRCTTCHTSFDPGGTQWDFAAARETAGRWHERNEGMGMAPPTLGIDASDRIVPVMPGMIATIEAAPSPTRSLRLHAAIVPHTTQREARTCLSCHADALALGLGEGALDLTGDAVRFTPTRPDPAAPTLAVAVALDRWVALFPDAPGTTTRTGGRSLDASEQRRVLTVGACLGCHAAADHLWSSPFARGLDRLARGDAPSCRGRFAPWMTSAPVSP